ncbi:MAG: peptidylprolyl isomerase [Deltaproteobacteria bacterium]|nr:peptidylprolyl isomerase [Deltaproteobacteria bacterium]MBW1736714.1 peptidylprolyl isomerase [Deltaproteobacteria bacterium]MBW1908614.1 peptidylprolyl isomerase [Deltaproteobacteria bacterium]MBW2033022.1 peptidylprolyl isomerase [Deltaproteobacteria bacterium]MBW2168288.1 peptidylprolyl isomerase [Deltaproteobacteria bacterium]
MKKRGIIFIICVGLFSFLLHPPLSAEIANRVVAIVNNDIITLHELNNEIKKKTGLEPDDLKRQDEKAYFKTGRKLLNRMIDKKISHDKVKELQIKVAPAEVDAAIKRVEQNNRITHEELLETLETEGVTYESYRENIRNQIERMRLINYEVKSKIIIREEGILEYYNRHKDEFGTEEKVRLAAIFLMQKDPLDQTERRALQRKGKKILSMLKDGESFGELAMQFSQGPGAKEGGDLGFFKTAQIDPELAKIVKEMSPGDVSGIITTPSGMKIIKLLEKQEKGVKTLEEARNAIYGNLYLEEVNKRYVSWIKELRKKAYIKVTF